VSLLQALILGIVQGFSEFLPISSSGHLVLVPFIFGWKEPTLAFIVAVHLGTTLSILWVFRERIVELIRSLFGLGNPADRRFVGLLAIGTVPAAIVGAVFSNEVDRVFERPVVISFLLAVTAWILFSAESHYEKQDAEKTRDERMMTPLDAAAIGAAQAFAILPGVSRSGSTIATGMFRGLSREAAAKFSFLMAIPIILGATVVKIPDMIKQGASGSAGAMIIGVIAATITGVLSIRAMIGVVSRRGFRPFAVYCLFAMTAGILTALARG
jgi:undecaprenyl-diphosphatase